MMVRDKDKPPTPLDELRRNLKLLKLLAMLEGLDEALEQAQTMQQGYATFLAGLVARQVLAVSDAGAQRRIAAARFPETKTFDTFSWTFQPGLNVQLVKDLMNLHFIRQGRPVLLFGRPGTGKTHMSIAYGHLAAMAGYSVQYFRAPKLLAELYASLADCSTDKLVSRLAKVELLIIDDIRHLPPRPEYASLLCDLIEARHQRKSTIVSSNLSVEEWGVALGNPKLTASLVDRLMERAHIINIKRGKSYRTDGPEAPPQADLPRGIACEPDEAE
jgi:DNA replication protein DnaC